MINFFKKLFNKSPKELFASFFQKIKNLFRAGSANQSQENNEPPQEPTNPTQAPTRNRINVAHNLPFRPPVSPMGPVSMPRTSSGSSRGSR